MFKQLILLVIVVLSFGMVSAENVPTGTIAYLDASGDATYLKQIRTIGADGSNDQLIWTVPDSSTQRINDIEWHPNGSRIGMTANIESTCSIFYDDVFTINANGSNLTRITNNPRCSDLASYPKGAVTVKFVNNFVSTTQQGLAYVEGADEAEFLTIPPGTSTTVTFNNVADLGSGVMQQIVFRIAGQFGQDAYWNPIGVDVVTGSTVSAPDLSVSSGKILQFAVKKLSWHPNGTEIGFAFADAGIPYRMAANSAVSADPTSIMSSGNANATDLAWSPDGTQVVYTDNLNNKIYLLDVGGAAPGTEITSIDPGSIGLEIDWIPDGSGFVVSVIDAFGESGNLFHYDIAAMQFNLLEALVDNKAPFAPSVSPDGQYVAYTIQTINPNDTFEMDLWLIGIDGTGKTLLKSGGGYPDWQPTNATPTAVGFGSVSADTPTNWLLLSALLLFIPSLIIFRKS